MNYVYHRNQIQAEAIKQATHEGSQHPENDYPYLCGCYLADAAMGRVKNDMLKQEIERLQYRLSLYEDAVGPVREIEVQA